MEYFDTYIFGSSLSCFVGHAKFGILQVYMLREELSAKSWALVHGSTSIDHGTRRFSPFLNSLIGTPTSGLKIKKIRELTDFNQLMA